MDNKKIIQTKATKEVIKDKDMRCSQEYIDELNKYIKNKIESHAQRAKANSRNTLLSKDL